MRKFQGQVLFNKRANGVHLLVHEDTEEPTGIRIEYLPDEFTSSPTTYVTSDNGETFYHCGIDVSPAVKTTVIIADQQTNPEVVANLRYVLEKWREDFLPPSTKTTNA